MVVLCYVRSSRQHTKSWTKLEYGKVSNFEYDFCRFTSYFLTFFTQVFSYSISHESDTSDVESSLIPYLWLPVPPAPPSVALIKICEAGLVLSVTRILRAALTKFRVYVHIHVYVHILA